MRILLLSFTLLAACGQSGDLYLPPEQPEAVPPATGTPPAEKDKKEEPPKEPK
jgi:predicted small lipoprotein YifL